MRLQHLRKSSASKRKAMQRMAETFELYLALSVPESDPPDQRHQMHIVVHNHRQSNGYSSSGVMQYQALVEQRFQQILANVEKK
jgi:hypothetical protein